MGEKEKDDVQLSNAQIDAIAARLFESYGEKIASRSADLVVANVQLEIGKSALRALAYVAGAAVVALVAWLTAHGYMKA